MVSCSAGIRRRAFAVQLDALNGDGFAGVVAMREVLAVASDHPVGLTGDLAHDGRAIGARIDPACCRGQALETRPCRLAIGLRFTGE